MDEAKLKEFTEKFLSAWNSQEVERVADCYTNDLLYLDPNTRGAITDQDSMRRYLTKLLAAWDMHWSLREAHLFEGQEGG
ncbi:MAG: nuclear transport factor 2 family protein, partial [bacterium]